MSDSMYWQIECELSWEKEGLAQKQIQQLEAENKLLRECVEFYADEDMDVYGEKARETLAKIKGDE